MTKHGIRSKPASPKIHQRAAQEASHALSKYRTLVPAEEVRDAARLLEDLKKSISTAKNSRLNSA